MTDTIDLFGQFLRGEPKGINSIVLAYRDPLISYGLKWVSRREDAVDAVMEAFAILQEKIGQFESEIHIKKFLHRTVKNKCLAAGREGKRYATLPGNVENSADISASEMIDIRESDAYSQWIIQKVQARLEQLPQKRRQDFHAHFFDSKSFKDIAGERGVSVDTVRQNVEYAVKEIRQYLYEKGLPGLKKG
ncbi:MAG TPA: sigma-70 family RNA polymerase sigma factor [Puia sp.]|nr:sigma-70 family RNA polymerase sigma factor [Puia sp.]